jgi:putative transposase
MRKKYLALSSADRSYLKSLVSKGKSSARLFKRAMALLQLDQGKTVSSVAESLDLALPTVATWRDRYLSGGLKAALEERPRSGRPPLIDGKSRAKITALACSTPPKGHVRWTLRLLADRVVEMGICENLSHTKASQILKQMNCSLT